MGPRHAAPRNTALRALSVLAVVLVLLAAGGFAAYRWAMGGAGGPSRPVTIEIPQGATAAEVGEMLAEAGVIRSAVGFRLSARVRGGGTTIFPGAYELRTNMSVDEVLDAIQAGPIVETVTVTFPEGLRLEQVAERLDEELGLDADGFVEAATGGGYELPPYLPSGTDTVEGFLFPKTYELSREVTHDDVIRRLLAQFEQEAATLDWSKGKKLGLDPYEAVILASLIEREAGIDEDRGKISSVIHNRLEKGMLLQIDATVQYALPEHKERLTYDDYKVESPYNTYLHEGLPPTPIANPGLESLRAALNPADTDFLFYLVVDPETGRHGFARTYDEFLALKNEVQSG